MKRLLAWLSGIPHLYGKAIVAFCVVNMAGMGWYALRIESRTAKTPAATLGVALGAIGIELLGSFCLACWIQFLSTGIIRYGGLFEDLVDALKLLKSQKSMTSQRDHASRIGKKNENTNK